MVGAMSARMPDEALPLCGIVHEDQGRPVGGMCGMGAAFLIHHNLGIAVIGSYEYSPLFPRAPFHQLADALVHRLDARMAAGMIPVDPPYRHWRNSG